MRRVSEVRKERERKREEERELKHFEKSFEMLTNAAK
jgi:hypothetical protein